MLSSPILVENGGSSANLAAEMLDTTTKRAVKMLFDKSAGEALIKTNILL